MSATLTQPSDLARETRDKILAESFETMEHGRRGAILDAIIQSALDRHAEELRRDSVRLAKLEGILFNWTQRHTGKRMRGLMFDFREEQGFSEAIDALSCTAQPPSKE